MGLSRFLSSTAFLFLLGAALVALPALGCGGGDDNPTPVPAPTVTAVAPGSGGQTGGTAITITGTNFVAGATVSVGASPATSVVVVNGTTITCTTPAGTGTVAVAVTTAGGTGSLPAAFTFHPAPTVTAATPNGVGTTGGRAITIAGTGFTANTPGPNAVTVGGAPATAIVTVNDTTITCNVPAGAAGPANVAVTNNNGTGTLVGGVTYVVPVLWAADAQNNGTVGPGTLFSVSPTTAAATVIGPTGTALTGMDMDAGGTLYGIDTWFALQTLYTVDLTTGAATPVGPLLIFNNIGDITFAGGTLIGNMWGTGLHSINTATGAATLIGPNGGARGQAMAADASGTVYAAFFGPPVLHTVNPVSGAITPGPTITGLAGVTINALTFLDGVLYGVENVGSGASATNLVTIDTTTGVATLVGALPPNIDALASSVR